MKKAAFLIMLLMPLSLSAAESVNMEQARQKAKAVMESLIDGDYRNAASDFNDTMTKDLPPSELEKIWQQLLTRAGEIVELKESRIQQHGDHYIVELDYEYEKYPLTTKITVDSEGRIAGLFFNLTKKEHEPSIPPPYADTSIFNEEEIIVGEGTDWALPGTITIPEGEGPFRGVVLVHGSGPLDRDETIGPNKPFRDIAWGLASKGVAVLRYEKRTKYYKNRFTDAADTMTIDHETVIDASRAVDAMIAHPRIDSLEVYLLGHSQGGYMFPRIAFRNEKIAGYILLAALAREIPDTYLKQVEYIFKADGELTEEEKNKLRQIEQQLETLRAPELNLSTPKANLPFGIPPKYWIDLKGYDPVKLAREVDEPILILQGARDYQVTVEDDLPRWKKALQFRDNVQFKVYDDLNHLFMEGRGMAIQEEFQKPGNVAQKVIEDISQWIKSR